jgi:hypothetical protein
MSMFCLNIAPSDGNGFCNQMFAICGMCSYAIEHKIPIIFISKYLKEIKTDKYCNIGEIINMDKTNHFLKKYEIIMPPKMDTYRDISAIIDMHNGQICNSTYIGVVESSFSFTLLARINNKHNMKTVMFYFNDLLHKGLIF